MTLKPLRKQTKAYLSLLTHFGALFALFMISDAAFAAEGGGIGDVADSVTGSLGSVAKVLGAISYIAGLGFAISGMVKFKAHKDQPVQVPLSQPITLILIAAGLIFLPSIIETAGGTLGLSSKTSASGAGFSS